MIASYLLLINPVILSRSKYSSSLALDQVSPGKSRVSVSYCVSRQLFAISISNSPFKGHSNMPPKAKNKAIEDKTFGMKNKNKSKKVQQYVQHLQSQVTFAAGLASSDWVDWLIG